MRATEIIRNVLDIIDQIEGEEPAAEPVVVKTTVDSELPQDDAARSFRQIIDLITRDDDISAFDNEPNIKIAGIDAVTANAGGGLNGPKHPADIKSATMPMYPGKVFGSE
jgi:hypothetical protein